MKTWVELTDLAGNVYKKKGSQARWVVHDVTLGADLVLRPYRFTRSTPETVTVKQEDFFKNYKDVT